MRVVVLSLLAVLAAPALASAAPDATRSSALDQCKAEIGWSRMTPAQQASAQTRFRLQLCLERKKVR